MEQCIRIRYLQTGVSANYAWKRDKDTLYIFFEKSNGSNDWKHNLDFPAKPYKRMGKTVWFAHRGFLKVWKEIEPVLADIVADTSVQRVIIAGYSHGAALALLCHEYVWYWRPDLRYALKGYGFACPRVFWGIRFADLKVRWNTFTVIRNLNDIVTHLPPRILGYSHMGNILEIGEKKKYSSVEAHYAENILTELRAYEQ